MYVTSILPEASRRRWAHKRPSCWLILWTIYFLWPLPNVSESVSLYSLWRHLCHDDVIKWKHFPRYWSFVRSPVNSPHKGQWRGDMMFSLICAWINGWVNNRGAGDLRRNRAHYDVTAMSIEMYMPHSNVPYKYQLTCRSCRKSYVAIKVAKHENFHTENIHLNNVCCNCCNVSIEFSIQNVTTQIVANKNNIGPLEEHC